MLVKALIAALVAISVAVAIGLAACVVTALLPMQPLLTRTRSRTTATGWWEADLVANRRGERDCYAEQSGGVCPLSDVFLDYDQLDNGDDDWEDRRTTAVHEVGHSVGLGHDTISAMISGEIPDTSLTWRTYSAHDIAHINAEW